MVGQRKGEQVFYGDTNKGVSILAIKRKMANMAYTREQAIIYLRCLEQEILHKNELYNMKSSVK